jgi:hypothetical protein
MCVQRSSILTFSEISLPSGYMPHKEGGCPLPTVSNGYHEISNGARITQNTDNQQQPDTRQEKKRKGAIIIYFYSYVIVHLYK